MSENPDIIWLQYFNRQIAIDAVYTQSKDPNTIKTYQSALEYFLQWVGDELPTVAVIQRYTDHLMVERGLKVSTVVTRYLVPVRHYLKHLDAQRPSRIPGHTEDEYQFAMDCREEIRLALAVPMPVRPREEREPRTDYHNWSLSKYVKFGDDPEEKEEK